MQTSYNALITCTWVSPIDTHNFKEGKIYEVKDGKLIDGNGRKSYAIYKDIRDINDSFYAEFKEV